MKTPTLPQIKVSLPPQLLLATKDYCDANGRDVSEFIAGLLRRSLSQMGYPTELGPLIPTSPYNPKAPATPADIKRMMSEVRELLDLLKSDKTEASK